MVTAEADIAAEAEALHGAVVVGLPRADAEAEAALHAAAVDTAVVDGAKIRPKFRIRPFSQNWPRGLCL
jgi:hypothetical protein